MIGGIHQSRHALYRPNFPRLASAICLASFGFLTMFFTARLSAQNAGFSLANAGQLVQVIPPAIGDFGVNANHLKPS
jgi:hypothetical protein